MFWRKSYQPFCVCNSRAAPAFLYYISTFILKSISILYNLYRATSVHCDIWLLVVWHHQFTICLLIHSYSLGSFTLWHHRNMFIFLFYAYSLLKEFLYINNYPEDLFIFWEFTARQISNTINIRILWCGGLLKQIHSYLNKWKSVYSSFCFSSRFWWRYC